MKRILTMSLIALAIAILVTASVGAQQQPTTDRFNVQFTDANRPGQVRVSVMTGSITVRSHTGRDVIITSSGRSDRRRSREAPPEAGGLRRLEIGMAGLSVEEDNNVMTIRANTMNRAVDMEIQVPARTNLKLGTMNDGILTVENVEGDFELTNHNGDIVMNNIAGSVVANSHNGDVKVSLRQVTAEKPMSFISYNGRIDVTLPQSAKANLKMRTDNGDIYSDFEVQLRPSSTQPVVQDRRNNSGTYRVQIDRSMIGAINGGGPEFNLRTYNGDIFVRKGAR